MEENKIRYKRRESVPEPAKKTDCSRESRRTGGEFEDFDAYASAAKRQKDRRERMQREKERRRKAKRRRNVVLVVVGFFLIFVIGLTATLMFLRSGEEAAPNKEATAQVETPDVTAPEENTPTPEEEPVAAMGTISSEYERVINRTYTIPENYVGGSGELVSIEGKQLEKNAAAALEEMLLAMRNEGLSIILQSAYRTDSDQEYLYNRQIGRQGGNEYKAATISAVPLTSEHQAGLAVDLSVDGTLTESFGSTAQGQWLHQHCAEYGFIERYPAGKERVTGIIWEPWHFRYVGSAETAQSIMNSGLCMEEYYGQELSAEDIDPYLPYL